MTASLLTLTAPEPEMSTRARVVTRRTYNRPLDDEGRKFETWQETVGRVLHHQKWLWDRAAGHEIDIKGIDELNELGNLMVQRKASVSGRTLWLGGTAVARAREASQFNPLPRDTAFITANGVKTFEDFEDGDYVDVITHLGNVKRGRVMSAGHREMVRIKMNRCRSNFEIDSCKDHMWILKDGTRKRADELVVGDQLHAAPAGDFYDWDFYRAPTDEQLYWCYGFVFGDGAVAKSGNSKTSRVRLCGNKAKYLARFTDCGFDHSFPPSCDEDPIVYTGRYLKTLPDDQAETRLIKAFLRGYLDADGNKKAQRGGTRFTGIATSDEGAAAFIAKYAPLFGLYILSEKLVDRDTNYGHGSQYQFSFAKSTPSILWRVNEITSAPSQDCWCLTVDDDHSFVLSNGVVSGNCSFGKINSVFSVVSAFWLLLQGCGVGFTPVAGILNGFTKKAEVTIVRSKKRKGDPKGHETNRVEREIIDGKRVVRIIVGDSAAAWAKAAGKLLAIKETFDEIIIDFSEVRAAGIRLKGYGWISSGDETISKAFAAICEILNKRAGQLLSAIDILDVINWLGTTLSSRRSAEIAVMSVNHPEADYFIGAKKDFFLYYNEDGSVWPQPPAPEIPETATEEERAAYMSGHKTYVEFEAERAGAKTREHRQQSNNSIMFEAKPTRWELSYLFNKMVECGGSEPGFLNATTALTRAPWFVGVNPCAEILLGDKSFCNLVEVDWGKYLNDFTGLLRAIYVAARANYRQTCVDLRDGILEDQWHELNEFLRLCGVGSTGIVKLLDHWEHELGYSYDDKASALREMRKAAHDGANSMADELGLPRPKLITTVKPSGTLSKIMDTTEGVHRPLGKFIFNNITFSKHDPIVAAMREAGYKVIDKPAEPDSVLITMPVEYDDVRFDEVDGKFVNLETAIDQLERYRLLMENYVDHNCSITVSYSPDEIPAIIDWILDHWDIYVGVSFIYRNDPTKTAEDLGYVYLPQEVVTEETYRAYTAGLKPFDLDATNYLEELSDEGCATGACPIR